jgi:uncharacterized protein
MLKVNLAALDRGEVHVREQVAPSDPMWAGVAVELAAPVEVDLTARAMGEGAFLRGRLRTAVRLSCRRCLTPVQQEIDDTVDLLFEPLAEEDEGADGEVYPLPARGDELDLRDVVREQVLLRAPEFALCRDDCRGLCPQCGTDLNTASCDCVPAPLPSAWDVLKNVKFDD